MDVAEPYDEQDGDSDFHGNEREFVMLDPGPERQELPGARREQKRYARAQGDDDDVIETSDRVAKESPNS